MRVAYVGGFAGAFMCCVFAAVYSVLLRSRTSSLLLCSHSSDPFAVSSRVSISVGKYLH